MLRIVLSIQYLLVAYILYCMSHSTVMQLIGQISYSYAENVFKECYINNTL